MKYLQLLPIFCCVSALLPVCVLIDPAGDVVNKGRSCGCATESDITYACAQELQRALKQRYYCDVVLSYRHGEKKQRQAIITQAHAPSTVMFIALSAHVVLSVCPSVTLYTSFLKKDVRQNQKNDGTVQACQWSLVPEMMATKLQQAAQDGSFVFLGLHTVPLAALRDIAVPHCMIDIGMQRKNDWQAIVPKIVRSMVFLTNYEEDVYAQFNRLRYDVACNEK